MTIIFTIAALAPVIPKIEMSFVSQFVYGIAVGFCLLLAVKTEM